MITHEMYEKILDECANFFGLVVSKVEIHPLSGNNGFGALVTFNDNPTIKNPYWFPSVYFNETPIYVRAIAMHKLTNLVIQSTPQTIK